MSEKILITSDSTTDLGDELIAEYGVGILPLGVALGEKQYTDGVDIDPDMIYANYERTGQLPKTSAINLAQAQAFFKKYTDEGYTVIFFTISATMSSTYQNVRLAASEFDNVYVIDTANLSTGGGLLVLRACEMAKEGKSATEIVAACEALRDRVDASFVIDSLEFLHKGGRCSALAAFGANLLNLKPCIVVRGGKMSVGKKYRGRFADVLKKYVADQIGDASDVELDHVFVTHAGCDHEIYEACVEQVKALAPFKAVHVTRAGCTVSSHCGRNTLGVLFIRKQAVGK